MDTSQCSEACRDPCPSGGEADQLGQSLATRPSVGTDQLGQSLATRPSGEADQSGQSLATRPSGEAVTTTRPSVAAVTTLRRRGRWTSTASG